MVIMVDVTYSPKGHNWKDQGAGGLTTLRESAIVG